MTQDFETREQPRRAFLLKALTSGLLAAGGLLTARTAGSQILGRRPRQLPEGQSVYQARGPVTVDGCRAETATPVNANARIETGSGAEFIFVIGSDAFLVRENTRMEFEGDSMTVRAFRVITGAVLSVFGRGAKDIHTPNGWIGIRGTGLYLEAEPERSYVCTCYGTADLTAADAPSVSERIVSRHHDDPRYILGSGESTRIMPAPFINHDDLELMLIETLVGRTPPFALFDEGYGSQRRY